MKLNQSLDLTPLTPKDLTTLRAFCERTGMAPQLDAITITANGELLDDQHYHPAWNYWGSLWFMLTLVTTVGYGAHSPETVRVHSFSPH